MIDVAIEDYFCTEISKWCDINKVILNPAWRSCREKFAEALEEQLNTYLLENDLDRIENSCTNYEIEVINDQMTIILNAATRKVEEIWQNVPCSHKKEKRRSIVSCCKIKLSQLKGIAVDMNLMESRMKRAQAKDVSTLSVEEAEEKWNKLRNNRKKQHWMERKSVKKN